MQFAFGWNKPTSEGSVTWIGTQSIVLKKKGDSHRMQIHEQKMSSAKRRSLIKDVSSDMQLSLKQIISSYFREIPILRDSPFTVFAINCRLNSAQDIK